jgi:hypothetical protein
VEASNYRDTVIEGFDARVFLAIILERQGKLPGHSFGARGMRMSEWIADRSSDLVG